MRLTAARFGLLRGPAEPSIAQVLDESLWRRVASANPAPAEPGGRQVPTSITLVIAALVVMIAGNLFLGLVVVLLTQDPATLARVAVSLGLGLLVLWGMIVGHRLAWQWGRILGIIGAVLSTIGGVAAFVWIDAAREPVWTRILLGSVLLVQAVCLYIIFFALGLSSARGHFNLRCPSCGGFTSTAADFFFNRAKCTACDKDW